MAVSGISRDLILRRKWFIKIHHLLFVFHVVVRVCLTFEGAVMSNFLKPEVAGYVGWVGNLNPTTRVKLHVSNVTVGTLDQNYAEFMSSYPIDFLKLTPRRAEESLVESLFGKHTTFSYYRDNADFNLASEGTECTLLDIINYIPSKTLPHLITDKIARKQRIADQNSVLQTFCAAYTSFYRQGMNTVVKQVTKSTCEWDDRDQILEKLMAFGPSGDSVLCVFEEVHITAVNIEEDCSYPPTGKVDFVTISEGNVSSHNTVAILKCIDDYPYPSGCFGANILPTYDKFIGFNVVPTTAKTNATFDDAGSNRQAVVELLALTEVLVRETGSVKDVKAVIILKASMSRFQPFIYFPNEDILITTRKAISVEAALTRKDSMMGYLVLFFLLRYKVNLEFPSELLKW